MDSLTAWLEFPSGERVLLPVMCTIGRTPENRVVIASEQVSRRHAVIRRQEDGTYQLMDMGSSNGSFIDGQRLSRPAPLQDGNVIEIGLQKMTFRTPPRPASVTGAEEIEAPCWLLTLEASLLGCRTPSVDLVDKTAEAWSERCHRVISRYRGTALRAANEGLLVFWRADGPGANGEAVAGALQSLQAVQTAMEEFRFTLHFGEALLRPSTMGSLAPSGSEVIFAMQLQRLVQNTEAAVLISGAARAELSDLLPMRSLCSEEMRNFRGSEKFYTLATAST